MLLGLWKWTKEKAEMLKAFWDWIGDDAAQLNIVVPLAIMIIAGIWALYRYFNRRNPNETNIVQNNSGKGDNVIVHKITINNRDPQDRDTIDALNTALNFYGEQLAASQLSLEERDAKIRELNGAVH